MKTIEVQEERRRHAYLASHNAFGHCTSLSNNSFIKKEFCFQALIYDFNNDVLILNIVVSAATKFETTAL